MPSADENRIRASQFKIGKYQLIDPAGTPIRSTDWCGTALGFMKPGTIFEVERVYYEWGGPFRERCDIWGKIPGEEKVIGMDNNVHTDAPRVKYVGAGEDGDEDGDPHATKQCPSDTDGSSASAAAPTPATVGYSTPVPAPAAAVESIDGVNIKTPSQSWIINLFNSTSGGKFKASRVEMVTDPLLTKIVSGRVQLMERRREGAVFNPLLVDAPKLQLKDELLSWCRTAELTDATLRKSNLVPVWNGVTSETLARSIAATGFAALAITDPGYHGRGRYCTPESMYGCMYSSEYPAPVAPNANGEWPLLLCIGAIGVAYPLTLCDHDFSQTPPTQAQHCRFFGKPFEAGGYDTHVVAVAGPEYLAVDPQNAEFHEIVFDQDAQLLPIAIVWFKRA